MLCPRMLHLKLIKEEAFQISANKNRAGCQDVLSSLSNWTVLLERSGQLSVFQIACVFLIRSNINAITPTSSEGCVKQREK